jgi:hypothetical protein
MNILLLVSLTNGLWATTSVVTHSSVFLDAPSRHDFVLLRLNP